MSAAMTTTPAPTGDEAVVTSSPATSAPRRPRVEWLDCLRVLATFAVIFDHVANQKWYPIYLPDLNKYTFPAHWGVLNFYESLAHWAVPVFVMISGSLFLGRQLTRRQIFGKYISRLATAFLFWTIIYAIIDYGKGYDLYIVISNLITGQMHFWYLLMIIGIYMIIPFLKKISDDEKLVRYYVGLSLIFSFAAYQIQAFLLANNSIWTQTMRTLNGYFCMNFLGVYTSYFLLGYYLSRRSMSRELRHRFYTIGLIGFLLTTGCSFIMSYHLGYPDNLFFDNITVNLFLASVGLFVFARDQFGRMPGFIKKFCAYISPYCFGIYLMHPIVIGYLETIGVNALWINPWVATPIVAVLVFTVCLLATMVLRNLPFIGERIT